MKNEPENESNTLRVVAEKLSQFQEKINSLDARTVRPLISVRDACHLLNISPRTCQNLRDRNLISYRKIGRRVVFSENDLQEFIEKSKVGRA